MQAGSWLPKPSPICYSDPFWKIFEKYCRDKFLMAKKEETFDATCYSRQYGTHREKYVAATTLSTSAPFFASSFFDSLPYTPIYSHIFPYTERPVGFYQISTTKKKTKYRPNYLKYRPHSTISTKYRPQKFLIKRVFTLFTFKSWDKHILRKWGLLWNMRDKWGPFQLIGTKANNCSYTKGITAVTILGF